MATETPTEAPTEAGPTTSPARRTPRDTVRALLALAAAVTHPARAWTNARARWIGRRVQRWHERLREERSLPVPAAVAADEAYHWIEALGQVHEDRKGIPMPRRRIPRRARRS